MTLLLLGTFSLFVSQYLQAQANQCCCFIAPGSGTVCNPNGLASTLNCDEWCKLIGLEGSLGDPDGYDSPATCQAICSTLPVELTFFEGQFTPKKGVELSWETAAEIDNQGFEIERTSDPSKAWQPIAFVAGKGTTLEIQAYHFIDKQPLSGINYYRLRQVDFDGAFEYSDIIAVKASIEQEKILLYPTTVKDILHIDIQSSETMNRPPIIRFFDVMGRPIQSYQDGRSIFTVSALPNGSYTVVIQLEDQIVVRRFFKE
ncbi:MAG: hypothetical protein AAGI49_04865 [Bacteroidota bacterium]